MPSFRDRLVCPVDGEVLIGTHFRGSGVRVPFTLPVDALAAGLWISGPRPVSCAITSRVLCALAVSDRWASEQRAGAVVLVDRDGEITDQVTAAAGVLGERLSDRILTVDIEEGAAPDFIDSGRLVAALDRRMVVLARPRDDRSASRLFTAIAAWSSVTDSRGVVVVVDDVSEDDLQALRNMRRSAGRPLVLIAADPDGHALSVESEAALRMMFAGRIFGQLAGSPEVVPGHVRHDLTNMAADGVVVEAFSGSIEIQALGPLVGDVDPWVLRKIHATRMLIDQRSRRAVLSTVA